MLNKLNKKLAFLVAVVAFGGSFAASTSSAADPSWCTSQCRGTTGAAWEACYYGCLNSAYHPR